MALVIAAPTFTEMRRLAQVAWPDECAGLLFGPPGAADVDEMVALGNVAEARGEAFALSGTLVLRALRARGPERPHRATFHSHPRGGATLSATDRRALAPRGEPLWPGVVQVVLAVRAEGVIDVAAFAWDAAASSYVPVAVEVRAARPEA